MARSSGTTSTAEARPPSLHRRRALALLCALLALGSLTVWRVRSADADRVHEFVGRTMGTSYRVRVDAVLSSAERRTVSDTLRSVLDRIDRRLSTYDTASELSHLNRYRSTAPFAASPELIEVVELARGVAERSAGAFDVTVGPLVEAWGFGAAERAAVPPTAERIAALRRSVGYGGLVVDAATGTVTKGLPETGVDLSAIGKGWAAERAGAALAALGYTRWLVEVGGELQAGAAKRDGSAWRVGVERPAGRASDLYATFDLVEAGVATSGDDRDTLELDGVRYAHIVDPRTGWPIRASGTSVTVVHGRAALADAWATALIVLGPEAGYAQAVEADIAALFLSPSDGTTIARATPAFVTALGRLTELDGR